MSPDNSVSVDFINPFLDATLNVVQTMAQIEVKTGAPFLKKPQNPHGDVTGVIGFASSSLNGSMALVFPKSCVLEIASKMLGEVFTDITNDVVDCVGELTNMVSGGAKKGLGEKGYRFEMAIPTTILGSNHSIAHKTSAPVIVIPFTISSGTFFVEASFQKMGMGAGLLMSP